MGNTACLLNEAAGIQMTASQGHPLVLSRRGEQALFLHEPCVRAGQRWTDPFWHPSHKTKLSLGHFAKKALLLCLYLICMLFWKTSAK